MAHLSRPLLRPGSSQLDIPQPQSNRDDGHRTKAHGQSGEISHQPWRIRPSATKTVRLNDIAYSSRLGGLLKLYERRAA